MSGDVFLRPPWSNLHRQHQAVLLGMWMFLGSEVLLFAGLFAGYTVYRGLYTTGFPSPAGRETDIVVGTANTAIMLTSSFFIAVAGRAARYRHARSRIPSADRHGGARRLVFDPQRLRVSRGHRETSRSRLGFRSSATGRDAVLFVLLDHDGRSCHLHVTGGLIAVSRLIVRATRDRRWLSGSIAEEATALYWHLVDVIWVDPLSASSIWPAALVAKKRSVLWQEIWGAPLLVWGVRVVRPLGRDLHARLPTVRSVQSAAQPMHRRA